MLTSDCAVEDNDRVGQSTEQKALGFEASTEVQLIACPMRKSDRFSHCPERRTANSDSEQVNSSPSFLHTDEVS